jgi:hypothetical protein
LNDFTFVIVVVVTGTFVDKSILLAIGDFNGKYIEDCSVFTDLFFVFVVVVGIFVDKPVLSSIDDVNGIYFGGVLSGSLGRLSVNSG